MEEVSEPQVSAGTVKLQVEWCGLCGTDVAEYVYGPLGVPTEPHPLTGERMPVILGHELTGTVIDLGAGAKGAQLGDRVLVNPTLRCGTCRQCKSGRFNLCDVLGVHGLSGGGGGLAEFTVVPDYAVHRIPDSLDMATATMAEPLAVALRAIDKSGASMSSAVCLIGAGPIGLVLAASLSALGVGSIAVVEPSPFRRRIASEIGCGMVIAPEELLDAPTPAGGFDVVFEASGRQQGLDSAISVTRAGGVLMLMARFKTGAGMNPNHFRREIDVLSSQAYVDEIPRAIELVASGSVSLAQIVSDKIDLSAVVDHGFVPLSQKPVAMGKVLVSCREAIG